MSIPHTKNKMSKTKIVSLVGGGGKTSTICYLSKKYTSLGKKVIITTTTHILKPEFFIQDYELDYLKIHDFSKEPLVIGNDCGKKLRSIDRQKIEILKNYADIIFFESDGSKALPIKIPEKHEPVIPKETDTLIVCMGIDAVGRQIKDVLFRYEKAERMYGFDSSHILTALDAAAILTDKNAGLKYFTDNMNLYFLINKADDKPLMNKAKEVKKIIEDICAKKNINANIVITSYIKNLYPDNIEII